MSKVSQEQFTMTLIDSPALPTNSMSTIEDCKVNDETLCSFCATYPNTLMININLTLMLKTLLKNMAAYLSMAQLYIFFLAGATFKKLVQASDF